MGRPRFIGRFPGGITDLSLTEIIVPVGTKFKVELKDYKAPKETWYSNLDEVLSIKVNEDGTGADVRADFPGHSVVTARGLRFAVTVVDPGATTGEWHGPFYEAR